MKLSSKFIGLTALAGVLFAFANDASAGSVSSAQSKLSASQRALNSRNAEYQQFMTERSEEAPVTLAAYNSNGDCSCCKKLEARISALESAMGVSGSSSNTSAQKRYNQAVAANSGSPSSSSTSQGLNDLGQACSEYLEKMKAA